MKSSKIRYWLSLTALVAGLSACIFFIVLLKSDHGSQFWTSLGFGKSGDTLNWCSNRVQSMNLPMKNGTITEEAGKWMWKATDNPSVELDYLSVEKWFAKHCQISIQKIKFEDFDSRLLPLIEVEFVNGDSATFYDLGKNRIQLDTFIFTSQAFQNAFQELIKFGPYEQ